MYAPVVEWVFTARRPVALPGSFYLLRILHRPVSGMPVLPSCERCEKLASGHIALLFSGVIMISCVTLIK